MQQKMSSARWMSVRSSSAGRRCSRWMHFIVDRQREFFEKGWSSSSPSAAPRGGRCRRHARVHHQPGDEREVGPDAAPGPIRPCSSLLCPQHRAGWRTPRRAPSRRSSRSWWVTSPPPPPSPDQQIVHLFQEQGCRSPAGRSRSTATGSASSSPGCGSAYEPAAPDLSHRRQRPDPAKDEAENLPSWCACAASALGPAGFGFEVIIVDDGVHRRHPGRPGRPARTPPLAAGACITARQRGIADALRTSRRGAQHVLSSSPGDRSTSPGGHSRAWWYRSSPATADIVTGTKQKHEKAFVSSVAQRLLCWLFKVCHRPQLGEGVPTRDHGTCSRFVLIGTAIWWSVGGREGIA